MTDDGGLPAIRESVQLTLEAEGPAGGHGTRAQLDRAVEYYALGYSRFAPGALFDEVRRCRRLVSGMLAHPPGAEAARRDLRRSAGWLSALLGNLAFHLGDCAGAWTHLAAAAELGGASGDGRLLAWSRGAQSMVARYQGCYEEAGRLAAEAVDLAPVPLARAQLLAWVRLPALAVSGQREEAERTYIEARDQLDADPRGGAPGRFGFDLAELELHAAEACVMLGLPEAAQAHAGTALACSAAGGPGWAASTATLAFAEAANDPGQAADRALDLLDRTPPERLRETTRRRLLALDGALAGIELPSARAFIERMRTLARPPGPVSPGEPRPVPAPRSLGSSPRLPADAPAGGPEAPGRAPEAPRQVPAWNGHDASPRADAPVRTPAPVRADVPAGMGVPLRTGGSVPACALPA